MGEMPPFYALKKHIGLFDSYHLNTYSVELNTLPIMLVNRAFGLLGFLGWGSILIWGGGFLLMRKETLSFTALKPLVFFSIAYMTFQTVMHVESRYSFPVVPFAFIAGAAFIEALKLYGKKIRFFFLIIAILLTLTFIWQTHQWDLADPWATWTQT
jgi:hypothetical protein